jgi:hypothetical protein
MTANKTLEIQRANNARDSAPALVTEIKMEPSKRAVIEIPMKEIWDQEGVIEATRDRYLSADDLKNMLKKFPVEFVIANAGDRLKSIPVYKCYEFWKSEVKSHLVSCPDEPFRLEDFPGEYAYLASEWSGEIQTPIVLLEKYH